MTMWSLKLCNICDRMVTKGEIMPKKIFFELNSDKRTRIIDTAISEFSIYGYEEGSTNRIVKESAISKGSLFQYFSSKEDLYFYVLDRVTSELVESIEKNVHNLSPELFQRVIDYSALEFAWYIQNPEKSKLVVKAFTNSQTDIYQKTIRRYGIKELNIYYKLLEDVDFSSFRWDKKKIIDIFKWFLKGFNEEFLSDISNKNCQFEYLHSEYRSKLTEYMKILQKGLLK